MVLCGDFVVGFGFGLGFFSFYFFIFPPPLLKTLNIQLHLLHGALLSFKIG